MSLQFAGLWLLLLAGIVFFLWKSKRSSSREPES
jgi:hypothetical protein